MATVPLTLLVLGGPDSGKSTYRAQLYQRVEHDEEGELRLVESVGDLSAPTRRRRAPCTGLAAHAYETGYL